jgi:hypothetical protein
MAAAFERWMGPRWSPIATAGTLALRVVALWSTAPSAWLPALVVPAGLGRLAAVGLQRLGDVSRPPPGRTFVVGRVTIGELVVTTLALLLVAWIAATGLGLAAVGVAIVVAIGLGLALQVGEGELRGDSLAVVAAAIELVAAVGLAAIDPASQSPFVR